MLWLFRSSLDELVRVSSTDPRTPVVGRRTGFLAVALACLGDLRSLFLAPRREYELRELGGEAWLNSVGKAAPADAGERL
jgi:hypothetical protein